VPVTAGSPTRSRRASSRWPKAWSAGHALTRQATTWRGSDSPPGPRERPRNAVLLEVDAPEVDPRGPGWRSSVRSADSSAWVSATSASVRRPGHANARPWSSRRRVLRSAGTAASVRNSAARSPKSAWWLARARGWAAARGQRAPHWSVRPEGCDRMHSTAAEPVGRLHRPARRGALPWADPRGPRGRRRRGLPPHRRGQPRCSLRAGPRTPATG
jgi:hypothetical protein